LREERRLRVLENRVLRRIFGPKRDEVTSEWRKLHNEELNDLYTSPNIVRVIKSRRMRWAGRVVRMGREEALQGYGGEFWGKETSWETRVWMAEFYSDGSSGSGMWGYGLDRAGSG
jgi:hypothetical protein